MPSNPPQPQLRTARQAYLGLLGWVTLCFAAAVGGVFFPPGEWYAQLQKPAWNPPGWIFGPVWTALYFMMALAAWLIWKRGGFAAQPRPLGLFLLQWLCNAAWSPLFFGWHQPALAFGVIVLLWLALLATLIEFWRIRPGAGLLLLPYLAWVTFAGALNFTLWRLNR